jgi:hypothetical protein
MKTTAYCDPASPDVLYTVMRAPGREPAYFPVRVRDNDRMRKRIAPTECPVRASLSEAQDDLEKLAAARGWRIAGTIDLD